MRIAVITPKPTPYRDPFWNAVAGQPGVELDVFYCTAVGEDRPWQVDWQMRFRAEVLPRRRWPGLDGWYDNPAVSDRLGATRYDAVVLGGYNHLTMLRAMRDCRRRSVPYLVMCESFLSLRRAWWRRILKTPLVRWAVRHAAGWLPTGRLAREYLLHYGAQADRICLVPNSPDLDALRREALELAPRRVELRRQFGWGDEPVVLFVGRLIRKKGVDVLIEALARLDAPTRLVVAGDGPERTNLECLAARRLGRSRAEFVGFRQPGELPQWYAAADVFCLPSLTEPWGVVVMEALASGLPVVVSELVGCHPDVLNDRRVGQAVPPGDPESLSRALQQYLACRPSRDEIHQAWQPVFEQMRHEVVAQNLVELLGRVASGEQGAGSKQPRA
ncbi:MAG: glycosyltransferase [Thermoguttaceae bacterium]|jgi:glycosyltransferase involved in cell wall biosynthesis|nr:glycosyltransferase [Thermoguttaceae bacterium]